MTTVDFIIVGAGSAGCVLANRLTENGRHQVVLIEAGGTDRAASGPGAIMRTLMLRVPAGFTSAMNDPKLNWGYVSDPQYDTGRTYVFTRGRVLGGSSSINGMIYVRGIPADYDGWRQRGCEGWSWSDVLPVFEGFERRSPKDADPRKALPVGKVAFRHPISYRICEAFEQEGIPATDDLNGPKSEGVTFARGTMENGVRKSAATAYLRPALQRPNLRLITDAMVRRVVFEGNRAIGVEIDGPEGRTILTAGREVILAAGAINSPQLLELSGIGDGDRLSRLGIPVVMHSPNVGEDLQDHYSGVLTVRMKPGTPSINELSKGAGLVGQLGRYAINRGGLLSATPAQVIAVARSRPELDLPDVQYFSSPATADVAKSMAAGRMMLEDEPGLTLSCYQLRPASRGSVHIRTNDPADHPSISIKYLSDPIDQQAMTAGLRRARRILAQPALAPLVDHFLTADPDALSDEELVDFAKQTGNTAYHYSGTCRMGGDDAVLTPRLAVRGIQGLRVVDASIMPQVVSGNTNAAVTMIAEKAATMILEDALILAA